MSQSSNKISLGSPIIFGYFFQMIFPIPHLPNRFSEEGSKASIRAVGRRLQLTGALTFYTRRRSKHYAFQSFKLFWQYCHGCLLQHPVQAFVIPIIPELLYNKGLTYWHLISTASIFYQETLPSNKKRSNENIKGHGSKVVKWCSFW